MTLKKRPHFRPASRALALEPRLLFDGAGAVAVVDGFDNGGDTPAPEAPAATPRPDEVLENGPEEALEPGAQPDEVGADVDTTNDTDTDTTTSSDSTGSGDS